MTPYFEQSGVQIFHGDSREVLRQLPAESVHCCVTSPPYWGLRDYGCDGQIGLEDSPVKYIATMREVFAEVRRVLRSDGVMFLNMGDSYYGSWGNYGGQNRGNGKQREINGGSQVPNPAYDGLQRFRPPTAGIGREREYGSGGTVVEDLTCRDCSSGSPCDEHKDSWLTRIVRTCGRPDLSPVLLLCRQIQACMEELRGHLPIEGLILQPERVQSASASSDRLQTLIRDVEPLLASLLSKMHESSLQRRDSRMLADTLSAFLLSLRSLHACAQEFSDKSGAPKEMLSRTEGSASPFAELESRILCTSANCSLLFSCLDYIQPQSSPILKPKDLVGIPWMLAFALREDGWYLRQDIVWSKPNPMPESVTDRCTKSHEYIFLLSKSERYYYNADAIKEDSVTNDIRRPYTSEGAWQLDGRPAEQRHGGEPRKTKVPGGWDTGNGAHGTIHRNGRTSAEYVDLELGEKRNKRSVWSVATEPFPEAHFATFPQELIKPCILAGCPEGGTVLDPFGGSGTTAKVARDLHCKAVLIELNTKYIEIAKRRLRQEVMNFA